MNEFFVGIGLINDQNPGKINMEFFLNYFNVNFKFIDCGELEKL